MASFVAHESCPRCGSRDNLGRYDDGSAWCFGCHLFIPVSSSSDVHRALHTTGDSESIQLPPDTTKLLPQHVHNWLGKYGITTEEALKWGWVYSPYYDQLIFPFYTGTTDEQGRQELALYQARNFNTERAGKRKYYNKGSPADILPIFHCGGNAPRRLVVVEDAVSAAKIARQRDAMPCLGSYLPARKLARLRPFYEHLDVWLDEDKLREAREISTMARWIGLSTRVIYTPLDPKEYTDDEIKHLTSLT